MSQRLSHGKPPVAPPRSTQTEPFSRTQPGNQQSLSLAAGGHRLNRSNSDAITYGDLLIAQYLDELHKAQPQPPLSKKKPKPVSPYLQRMPAADSYRPQAGGRRDRPASASVHGRSESREKRLINAKFIVDMDQSEGEADSPTSTERTAPSEARQQPRRQRPRSAPARRPTSAKSTASTVSNYSSLWVPPRSTGKKPKRDFEQQPHVIRAIAYKNGSREKFCAVAAPNIKMLLEACTDKLGLNSAGRKVYLEDGKEAITAQDIARGADIYISCGETFKNPYASLKGELKSKKSVTWTMNGIVIPANKRRGRAKLRAATKMRKMAWQNKRRVMVFKNGDGTEMAEVVASLEKDEETWRTFLDDCTSRLNLMSPAKTLFTWTGQPLTDLDDAPKLDRCLQHGITPALGPLWVSKGEGFSPKGTKDFLLTVMKHCDQKLEEAATYKEQLDLAEEGETKQVKLMAVLSMSSKERKNALKETEKIIHQFKGAKLKLKNTYKQIRDMVRDEEEEGYKYTMTHIKQLKSGSRLHSSSGIRLKVYLNGNNAGEELMYFNFNELAKGAAGNHAIIRNRFLDECTRRMGTTHRFKRVFDREGRDIVNPLKLEPDQEIWLSLGEKFKISQMYALELTFDKAKGYILNGDRNEVLREPLALDELGAGAEKPSQWEVNIGFPVMYDFNIVDSVNNPSEAQFVLASLNVQQVDTRGHFLQKKDKWNLVLYPELAVSTKKKRGHPELWPSTAQIWVINQSGLVYCKSMPSLVLSVTDWKVESGIARDAGEQAAEDRDQYEGATSSTYSGLAVSMQKRMLGNPCQQWGFSPEGLIYSLAHPSLALTHLGGEGGEEELPACGDGERVFPGNRCCAAIIDRLPAKHPQAARQRWAVKQETFHNLGQWKHSTVANPLWNKLALSWPTTQDGTWNQDFDWPMEGYLLPLAPPMKKPAGRKQPSSLLPVRLRVLKNGEKDVSNAICVVGPDLTNMAKDLGGKKLVKSKSKKQKEANPPEEQTFYYGNTQLTLKQLEMQLFLDRCTSMLNLPFAARRMFDEQGGEQRQLDGLERDQLVYVSCGEAWTEPSLSRVEQQRRRLLANLAQDVDQIRQYCALKNVQELVMEVEGPPQPGCRLVVATCCLDPVQRETLASGDDQLVEEEEETQESETDPYKDLSSHEKAHMLLDKKEADGLKWPWERVCNNDIDQVDQANEEEEDKDEEVIPYSNLELYEKFKLKPKSPRKEANPLKRQQFVYMDGFLCLRAYNSSLVVSIPGNQEAEHSGLVLEKKNSDDINQRWIIENNGAIRSKAHPNLVMGVAMVSFKAGDENIQLSYEGQPITMQHHKNLKNGGANQKWSLDTSTGFLDAFQTEESDIEVTTANNTGVCTFAVFADTPIEQPVYVMSGTESDQEPLYFCLACAVWARGRHQLTRVEEPGAQFTCCLGTADQRGLKVNGCFKIINGKVDLSAYEAQNSLTNWTQELMSLREEGNPRAIAKAISAYQPVQNVWVRARKNGQGLSSPGQVMVGSSIPGLLDQCGHWLGLTSAARRIYTVDGTQTLSVEDLINWMLVQPMEVTKPAPPKKQSHNPAGGDASQQKLEGIDLELKNMTVIDRPTGGVGPGPDLDRTPATEYRHLYQWGSQGQKAPAKFQDGYISISDSKVSMKRVTEMLKNPIDVWVSMGEPFVRPFDVEQYAAISAKNREERAGIIKELDKEKHVLRQLQGRRTAHMSSAELVPTDDVDEPVRVASGWAYPTDQEHLKATQVKMLEEHLSEVRDVQRKRGGEGPHHKPGNAVADPNRRLYLQPSMKRVLVFVNGGSPDQAVAAWGNSLRELLENITSRLGLHQPARQLYAVGGEKVESFEDIKRNQLLAVSTGKPYKSSKGSHQNIMVKANWARVRKTEGAEATDITVNPVRNPTVDVDPFGPPSISQPSLTNGH